MLGASAFEDESIIAHEKTKFLIDECGKQDWASGTLDAIKALEAEVLIGGRGAVARGREQVDAAIEQTRGFLKGMIDKVGEVHRRGGTLKEAFEATHEHLAPQFGQWPIFEHCLPFDVQRLWDEFDGIDWPRI